MRKKIWFVMLVTAVLITGFGWLFVRPSASVACDHTQNTQSVGVHNGVQCTLRILYSNSLSGSKGFTLDLYYLEIPNDPPSYDTEHMIG